MIRKDGIIMNTSETWIGVSVIFALIQFFGTMILLLERREDESKWEDCWYGCRPKVWTYSWVAVYLFLVPGLLLFGIITWVGEIGMRIWHFFDRPIRKGNHDG
jgi:hypothetical protein